MDDPELIYMMVLRVAISRMPVYKVSCHIWTYTANIFRNMRSAMMHLVSGNGLCEQTYMLWRQVENRGHKDYCAVDRMIDSGRTSCIGR